MILRYMIDKERTENIIHLFLVQEIIQDIKRLYGTDSLICDLPQEALMIGSPIDRLARMLRYESALDMVTSSWINTKSLWGKPVSALADTGNRYIRSWENDDNYNSMFKHNYL